MKKQIFFLCITFCITTVLSAAPPTNETFTGTWVATVEHNRSFDTYEISFASGNRCTVKISNDRAEQETAGTWSWDGTLFRLNAVFRNPRISYQNNIQWVSVLSFVEGNEIFNILGRPAVDAPQIRFTFVKQDSFVEDAVAQTFNTLIQHIPQGSRIAIINITSADADEGTFFLDEITLQFVNSRRYTVVERRDIEVILAEQNFQISGYVDDDSIVSIGKILGVTVAITGNISGTGSRKRLVLKALDVETAVILAMSSVSL
jgi:hypothetical protein